MTITANQVTFMRLALMPILASLLYFDQDIRVFAVIAGTFVGFTDTLDGYLARKQGPTVLGGLMDPIADKVFIIVCYVPYVDRGWGPWWVVALIFLREFVITALRSSFLIRDKKLSSSYFAKVKTWVQMIGVGLLLVMVLPYVERTPVVMSWLLGFATALSTLFWVTKRLLKGAWWRGALLGTAIFGTMTLTFAAGGRDALVVEILVFVLVVTWLSAIDYFRRGWELLRESHGPFDSVRLLGAATTPLLAMTVLVTTEAPAAPIIALLCFELTVGGLDNLLADNGVAPSASRWMGRALGVPLLLGLALALPAHAAIFAIAAGTLSFIGSVSLFIRERRHYLDTKPLAPAALPQNS